MENILLDRKDVYEYIYESLNEIKSNGQKIENARYHHNCRYNNIISICKNGILTLRDMNKLGIRNDSKEFLKIMDDNDSHINGINNISLAVVGLKDIYRNEDEYNPFSPNLIDILVSSEIKTRRCSIHYGNEFLHQGSISKEKIKSIDIRILKLLEQYKKDSYNNSEENIIKKYNRLKDIALELKEINIPIRELSENNIYEINKELLIEQPKILLKN